MDGSGFMKYSFGEIGSLGDQITGQANEINRLLEEQQAQIQKLTDEWGGNANEAFVGLKTKWEQAAFDLRQVMAQIGAAVRTTAEDAQATEQRNTSLWG